MGQFWLANYDQVPPLYHMGGVCADRGDDSSDRDGLIPLGSRHDGFGLKQPIEFRTDSGDSRPIVNGMGQLQATFGVIDFVAGLAVAG